MERIKLNYKMYGEGEAVIILHGFLGMLDNWKTFGRKLSADYQVFLLDQRDHGRSPHTDAFTYDLLAEDLADFMEDNDLEAAHLIGHSMGGKAAMKFAEKHPDKVHQLIIVDVAPKTYPPYHSHIIEALNAVVPSEIRDRNEADAAFAEYITDFGVRQFLMKNLSRSKTGGFEWKMNLPLLTQAYAEVSTSDVLGPVQVNALFVNGSKSPYITTDDHELILEKFPNAKFETIEGAGHWVHAEKGDELLEVVSGFLKGSGGI